LSQRNKDQGSIGKKVGMLAGDISFCACARFLEAALSGSAEFQIADYIDGARADRVSRANKFQFIITFRPKTLANRG